MKKSDLPGFSTLSQMYSAWMQFEVPVTFYHYFLSLLKNKPKNDQTNLMNKQISSLKSGTHLYLKIKYAINARQNSLSIIRANLHLLKDQQTLKKPLINSLEQRQMLGYKKLFDTNQNLEVQQNRKLRQLANHLVIYRKITLQIIFLIHKWVAQLMSLGYEGGLVQFFYKNEDYLQEITQKIMNILNEYSSIFQFNPFFLLKRELANGNYALVYNFLKVSSDVAKNYYEALKLLAEHHSDYLKLKILGRDISLLNKKHMQKSNSVDKIYGNLLNGNEFSMIKDSYLKSSKLLSKQNSTIQTLNLNRNKSEVKKIINQLNGQSVKNNSQNYKKTNFIQRKYPTFFSDNTQNQVSKGKSKQSLTDYLLLRRYSANDELDTNKKSLIAHDHFKVYMPNKKVNKVLQNKLKMDNELYQTKQSLNIIPKVKQIEKNDLTNSKIIQNQQMLIQNRQYLSDDRINRNNSVINIDIDMENSLQNPQMNQNRKLQFKVEKNIYSTNLLRYLRDVFRKQIQRQDNENRMTSDKIQKLAKVLLGQRQHISIYKIFNKGSNIISSKQNQKRALNNLVAWMVCKLYKDTSTLQKTVDILFMYQFKKINNLQNQIINYFSEFGYCNLKQNGKLVYESTNLNNNQYQGTQVVRCKYKISPYASQQDIKDIVKTNVTLKMSRILKYHYYSKTSKYHKYCQHNYKQSICQINYLFSHTSKVFINNKSHVKVKIDSIQRIKQCYKIYHHLNKGTFLILATSIQDLKQMETFIQKEDQQQMDQDQSFDNSPSQNHCDFNYICLQEGKIMRKYVNQKNKPVINQFVWIENGIPQIKSIAIDKKQITGSDCLVLSQPYVLGIYGKNQPEGLKSLAILDFTQ